MTPIIVLNFINKITKSSRGAMTNYFSHDPPGTAFITSANNFFFGFSAKNDKNTEVYLPPLAFGERRYFAPIQDSEQTLLEYVHDLIWKLVESYIPASYLDAVFDVPHPVKGLYVY